MENFGCPPPLAPATGRQIVSNVDVIASVLQGGRVVPDATAEVLNEEMAKYRSADGGPCSHAGLFFMSLPAKSPTLNSTTSYLPGGFVWECDRYGGELRLPNAPGVVPASPHGTNVFGSNHYHQ